jgi:predicted metal-dependent phosphoesterase TrpH
VSLVPQRTDLHCHSSASDGTRPPAEVVRRAAAAGVDAVALTDHDTVAGLAQAAAALPPGLTLLPGMELSCRYGGRSVHLLSYLFNPAHPELAAECVAIRDSRVLRAQAMVDRLAGLGVPVTWDQVAALAGDGVVGRPHIARAMVAVGAISAPAAAFTSEWIGTGGRAHVSRYALEPAAAIALVRAAGGVSVLAHPLASTRGLASPDGLIEELAAAGLTGIEVDHPDHDSQQRGQLRATAARLGLACTGGSDDHGELTGDRLGCDVTAADQLSVLLAGATGALAVTG